MWPERTYWATVSKHFTFTKQETTRILATILFLGLMMSFNLWGPGKSVDVLFGLKNFITTTLIAAFSVLCYISVQRLFAISRGYQPEYTMWSPSFGGSGLWIGVLVGSILVILSSGRFWWVAVGGMAINMLPGHRLGWFRYEMNMYDWALVSVAGPVTSIILALLFKSLSAVPALASNEFIPVAVALNVWMAIQNMIPIPNLDGSRVFFGSRLLWVFSMTLIVVAALQAHFLGAISAAITGIVLLLIMIGFWASTISSSPEKRYLSSSNSSSFVGVALVAVLILVLLSVLLQHIGAFIALFLGFVVAAAAVLMWIIFVEKML